MERPFILHMMTPLKHVSPFDVDMALDAGFDAVVPYTDVELGEVTGLVQDAIFSRAPKDAKRTGIFIGGRDAKTAVEGTGARTVRDALRLANLSVHAVGDELEIRGRVPS